MSKKCEQTDYTVMAIPEIIADIKTKRDYKLENVLANHLPAWIVQERINTTLHTCTFDIVFRPASTWQKRRYTYDAEVDVLHYRGAEPFDEAGLGQLTKDLLYQLPID